MAEKYIDLAGAIEDDNEVSDMSPSGLPKTWIRATLLWLDRHPGQVPGRTITQGEYEDALEGKSWDYGVGYFEAISRFDITVVPEPTNAEKATDDLQVWGIARDKALELGPWLAGQGWTKAPGGGE